jgi:hypothetical protein
MPEDRWTERDFVELARPKMMAAANPGALPRLLFQFFSEALPHYDDATVDGKSHIDKAMESLVAGFEASKREDFETAATGDSESTRKLLEALFLEWREKRQAFLRIQAPEEFL